MQLEELSNISDNLAMMPDPALRQFAQMHRQDPYMVSLALSESNRRKKLRTAKQGQAGAMPQPKVVDAAIQGMAQTQLPENQGIAQIPAPNMQAMADGGIAGYDDAGMTTSDMGGMFDFAQRSEPVVRMSGGGMLNFSSGGTKKLSGSELFDRALDMEGITNPRERAFLKAIHAQESSGKATEKTSNRDAHGAMQILPATFKSVADAGMDINKPLDNMRAGIRYGMQGFSAAKGNPVLAGAYYYGGPGGMQKAAKGQAVSDPKNPKAPTTIDYGNSIAQRMTAMLPIGSAVAEEIPGAKKAPVDTSLAAQIPGQAMQAPASNYDQTNSFFGRIADKMGIPLEGQRQIGTTFNVPTPMAAFTGAFAIPKTGGALSGITALGGKIGDKLGFLQGPKGRMSAQEIAALQKESEGLRALETSQKAIKEAADAADAARMSGATVDEARLLSEGVEKAAAAAKATEAAKLPSAAEKIARASEARELEDVLTAQRLMRTTEQAQTAGRADALADKALSAIQQAPQAAPSYAPNKMEPVRFDEFDPSELSKPAEKEVIDAAKEATPAKERKGFNNDDLLTLGLSLLANKSPNFMTALGEAGLATVAGKKEREKTEREEAKLKGAEELQKAQAKYYGSYADAIERGAKEKDDVLLAEKAITDYMESWDKAMVNKMGSIGDPAARARVEEAYRQRIYTQKGITPIMGKQSASSAANPDPLGILGKR